MQLTHLDKIRFFNLSSFAYQAFIALWVIAEIYTVGNLWATDSLVFSSNGSSVHYCDFFSFYKCGKIVSSATPWLLYDPATQLLWLNKLIAPAVTHTIPFSQYTPPFCLFMGLLSFWPITWSYIVWVLGTATFALYALRRLLTDLNYLNRQERWLFMLAVVSSLPGWLSIRDGQCSWLILGMAALFIACFLKKKDFLAGFYLSIIAIKP